MLYYLVRPLARLALKFWFRKIYRTHMDRVPRDKPVIFAVNHPTIFIEPCLLACYQPRALFFLTKGVLFVAPFVTFLKSLHMVPIYRRQDGSYTKRKSNINTFDYCYHLFDQQHCTMIMPEGSSSQVKHLRPLTKGFARLAFSYYEERGSADIFIQPVGVNYSDADTFRSEVALGFGKPLYLKNYITLYKKNPRAATQKMVEDLYEAMKKQMVHVLPENLELAEKLWTLHRNDQQSTTFPILEIDTSVLKDEKSIGANLTCLSKYEKSALTTDVNTYFSQLEKLNLNDAFINTHHIATIKYLLFFIVGLIPACYGFLTNILPYLAGQAAGSKTKDVETRMSVVLGITFGVYLVFMVILLCYTILNANWVGLLYVLAIPFCGYLSLIYIEKWRDYKDRQAVRATNISDLTSLRVKRRKLMEVVKSLRGE